VSSIACASASPGAHIHIDDRSMGSTPFTGPLRVSAGRRRVTAELAGRAPLRRTIDLVGGDSRVLKLRFGPDLMPSQTGVARNQASSLAPWVMGIMSGALAIGGGAFAYAAWRDTVSYDDQLNSYTTRDRLEQLSSNARTKAVVADVLLGAAVVGAVVTTVLLFTNDGAETPKPNARAQHKPPPAAF
jgi:hypothetical protein